MCYRDADGLDRLISTMETETVAARNVVELLMKEQFDAGLCKTDTTPLADDETGERSPQEKEFVYGWDC